MNACSCCLRRGTTIDHTLTSGERVRGTICITGRALRRSGLRRDGGKVVTTCGDLKYTCKISDHPGRTLSSFLRTCQGFSPRAGTDLGISVLSHVTRMCNGNNGSDLGLPCLRRVSAALRTIVSGRPRAQGG